MPEVIYFEAFALRTRHTRSSFLSESTTNTASTTANFSLLLHELLLSHFYTQLILDDLCHPKLVVGRGFCSAPLYEGKCIAHKAGDHFMSILIFYTATINLLLALSLAA
jgi:hypothetical protein